MSGLVGRWSNPEGGETVEFTFDGNMIVTRGDELLTEQRYAIQVNRNGGGRISLRMEGVEAEVVLGFHVEGDILAMSFGGETTVYKRV